MKTKMRYVYRTIFVSITVTIINFSFCQADSDRLYVGVLESRHSNWPGWFPESNKTITPKVRILYLKEKDKWISLEEYLDTDKYPLTMHWYIAFDGQLVGELQSSKSKVKYNQFGKRDLFHIPNQSAKIPSIGKPTNEFSGWAGGHYLRPLITVSEKNYTDSSRWKPFKPSLLIVNKCVANFRDITGKIYNYDQELDETIICDYKNENINVLKSYKSNLNEYLVCLQLEHSLYKGNIIIEQVSEWAPKWFYVKNDSTLYIGDSMKLIDAGDYDNDGKPEVLFWAEGYNEDGYIMFYNDFSTSVSFKWRYH